MNKNYRTASILLAEVVFRTTSILLVEKTIMAVLQNAKVNAVRRDVRNKVPYVRNCQKTSEYTLESPFFRVFSAI
jgi:hypothetical protein